MRYRTQVTTRVAAVVAVVEFEGRDSVGGVAEAILKRVGKEQTEPSDVVLDVSELHYAPGMVERLLMATLPALRQGGVVPHVVVGTDVELLVLAKLATVCDVYVSEREALQAVTIKSLARDCVAA